MMSVFLETLLFVFVINFVAYLIAYWKQTDHLTDLTYNLSFLLAVAYLFFSSERGLGETLVFAMVAVWAIRLGAYLFKRINKMGRDKRFDEMRPSAMRFLGFWSLQTISIWIILIPVIRFFQSETAFKSIALIGCTIWLLGFLLETIADQQKFRFKNKAENKGKFIQTGLWRVSRHPNYLGEMLCWWGVVLYNMDKSRHIDNTWRIPLRFFRGSAVFSKRLKYYEVAVSCDCIFSWIGCECAMSDYFQYH